MRTMIRSLIPALALAAAVPALPVTANAGIAIGLSVNFAPPELPVYEQPPIPAPGYIWVPGYWSWDGGDYYWVPGTWALAPVVGYLWTPGYWGWGGGAYLWHAGYWGPHVGFYGGINYGFGYTGVGYEGGYWRGHEFCYNRAVNNVSNVNVTNVYNRTVINNVTINRTSFNGGAHGVMARPSHAELYAARERHVGPSGLQREHESFARSDTELRASVNGGRPPIAATPRPAAFHARGVVAAREPGAPQTVGNRAQYRNDRPSQSAQASAPQNRADRPSQVPQVSEPQNRADRPSQVPQVNAPQFRADRPAQAPQVNAPQFRADRPAQAPQVNAPQNRAIRPAQAPQVNAPQYRADRPSQAPQVNAPQNRAIRPAQAPHVSAPQYHAERQPQASQRSVPQYRGNPGPQPAAARPVSVPPPASRAQPHTDVRAYQPAGHAGNTHENHAH
jgi:hypothetical protein